MRKNYAWKRGEPPPRLAPHSLSKHRIFRRYVERYIEIVTRNQSQTHLNLTIVDGFCGGGLYRLGDHETVEGSPLILLRAVAEAAAKLAAERPKGFTVDAAFYFIDASREHCDHLRSVLKVGEFASGLDVSISIMPGDFNVLVPSIIAAMKRRRGIHRSLFFLDQNGWSELALATVRRILAELTASEVFLTFSVDALIDHLTEQRLDMRAYGQIDLDRDFAAALARIREDKQVGWRALIQNGLYGHVQRATGALFYSPFFVRSAEAHRAYWLLHLSKHPEARNEVGNIHWQEANASTHHGLAGFEALGFTGQRDADQFAIGYEFDAFARAASRDAIEKQLPDILRAAANLGDGRTISVMDVFGCRCNDTPVTRDLLAEILIEMRDQRELTLVSKDGRERRRPSTVDWSTRIELTAQRSFWGPINGLR